MLFGRFCGVEVADLPDDYLRSISSRGVRNVELRAAIEQELRARASAEFSECDGNDDRILLEIPAGDAELLLDVVNCGYRTLSRRLHPDQGGDVRSQARLNDLVASLRRRLQEASERAPLTTI